MAFPLWHLQEYQTKIDFFLINPFQIHEKGVGQERQKYLSRWAFYISEQEI